MKPLLRIAGHAGALVAGSVIGLLLVAAVTSCTGLGGDGDPFDDVSVVNCQGNEGAAPTAVLEVTNSTGGLADYAITIQFREGDEYAMDVATVDDLPAGETRQVLSEGWRTRVPLLFPDCIVADVLRGSGAAI